MNTPHPALHLSDRIAELLADPAALPSTWTAHPSWRQSLAHGAPGIALLHAERAATGRGRWETAAAWLSVAASGPVTRGPDSYLYYGAPALTHALDCAARARPGAYRTALAHLDRAVAEDALHRCAQARARLARGDLPALGEFDTIRGLAGLGSLLLRREPNGRALREVLACLIRLTRDVKHEGDLLPGWWTADGPAGKPDPRFPGGHGNNGLAHGIAGPLALLSLALLHGIEVEGQQEAIRTVLAHLERLRNGHAWPYWVTRDRPHSNHKPATQRPSWCYGTAGVARAQQLAALVLDDPQIRHAAEDALAAALTDTAALAATTDLSACHGFAGLAHIAHRAAADADPPGAARLRTTTALLLDTAHPPHTEPDQQALRLFDTAGPALLEGAAGTALALLAPTTRTVPATGWDACLLIT
ncbi:lanthionine synthetase LanC family protein [Kitasatospora phosalacinea]|uniref:lanthionine synthetase LanC family protein n=1 Tax=Kitasatospora phosalacinea TaxID=2065 RepID=UPI00364B5C54